MPASCEGNDYFFTKKTTRHLAGGFLGVNYQNIMQTKKEEEK